MNDLNVPDRTAPESFQSEEQAWHMQRTKKNFLNRDLKEFENFSVYGYLLL